MKDEIERGVVAPNAHPRMRGKQVAFARGESPLGQARETIGACPTPGRSSDLGSCREEAAEAREIPRRAHPLLGSRREQRALVMQTPRTVGPGRGAERTES